MNSFISKLLDGWEKSFNVTEQGYSRKKLVAYTFVLLSAIIEIKWAYKTISFEQLENVLMINVSIIFAMLGVSSIEKVQLTKMNLNTPPKTVTEETNISQTKTTETK
jgi:hypothetical protein